MVGDPDTGPNADEARYWASPTGQTWIENEKALDELLAPVTQMALQKADLRPGHHVLDIGCGTGAHAIGAAGQVAPGGRVLALDISPPLLARAQDRVATLDGVAKIDFLHADAQTVNFDAGTFDVAISRFGVMFFSDPAAAFANIARGLKPGGRMVFAAWGPVSVNPWWRLPGTVAKARLGEPPASQPNAPGPMGLADMTFVEGELRKAAIGGYSVEQVTVTLTHAGGAQAMAALSMRVGPAARLMRLFEGTVRDADAIEAELTGAYRSYEDADGFHMPATINLIQVQVP